MRKNGKRVLSLLLALVMVLGMLPEAAWAAEGGGTCGENVTWTLENGVLTVSGTGAMEDYGRSSDIPWYSQRGEVKSVVISDDVTSIGKRAFDDCTELTSVTIPNSVTSIGEFAFADCSHLTNVTLPNGITNIDTAVFWQCTALTNVTIPNGVTSIGPSAFRCCKSITSVIIPSTVTRIGNYAFYSCTSLTNVTIPNSVTSIEMYAFYHCTGLTSVAIPNSITSINESVFEGCTGLTNVMIPDSVTSIETSAFHDCSSLKNITIPKSVTSIKDSVFEGCTSLTSVTIPDGVTNIEGMLFRDCSGLTSITIPNSVTSIYVNAFSGCTGLTNVTISNSVTSIGYGAFVKCTGLTSVTIPTSVTSISQAAFWRCDNLADIYYGGTEAQWNAIKIDSYDNDPLKNATIHYNSNGPEKFSLTSADPGTCIQVGHPWDLNVKYMSGGKVKDADLIYTISDGDIFDIVRTGGASGCGQDYKLTAKKPGYCTVTFTEPSSGDAVLLEVYAVNGESGYTFETVPQMTIEEGKTTNFYNYSGMVVDEFKSIPIKDENGSILKYHVSMTVYNSLNLYAAVTSYDKNGDMKGYYLVDKMESQPSGFTSTLTGLYYRTGDLFHHFGNNLYYSGKGTTKETKVDIDVLPGGYLEISNNASSGIVVLANTAGMIIEGAKTIKELATHASALEEHKKEIIMKVLMETFSNENLSKKICDTVKKSAVEEFKNMEWNYDTYGSRVQAFQNRLSSAGVNLVDTLSDEIVSLTGVASITEDVLFKVIPTGNLINYLYGVAGLVDKADFWDTFMKSAHFSQGIYFYAPGGGNEYLSNGVRVASEEQIKQDTLIHAYLVLDTSELSGSRYQTYNISMYRNGEKTQPDTPLTVSIPVPDGYRANSLKVYRKNDDGTVTDMNAEVVDGYAVFTTTHFSYYAIVDNEAGGIFLSDWTPGKTTTVQLSDPGNQLKNAIFFAACYKQNRQIAQVVSGIYSSEGHLSFNEELSVGWELFILDPATYTPLCPNITLSASTRKL